MLVRSVEFLGRLFVWSRAVKMNQFCLIFTPEQSVLKIKSDQGHTEIQTQVFLEDQLIARV